MISDFSMELDSRADHALVARQVSEVAQELGVVVLADDLMRMHMSGPHLVFAIEFVPQILGVFLERIRTIEGTLRVVLDIDGIILERKFGIPHDNV